MLYYGVQSYLMYLMLHQHYYLCQGGYIFANCLFIYYHDNSKQLSTNFDENFWRGGICDWQLMIRFWW